MVQRRLDVASDYFEKAFALNEVDISSGCLLITCYTALGDAERLRSIAERTLERAKLAVASDPGNGSAMGAMCSCLMSLGETERAREWARRAILMDPENMGMRYNLACDVLANGGELDLGIEMLTPVLQRAGREQIAWLIADPDLDRLRDDERFNALIAEAQQRLDAARD
jgi:adenylate cyclase